MVVTDGVVSLKHLVSMEILSNEEVLGLIKRGLAFKKKEVSFTLDRQYFAANLFLNHQRVPINLSKWPRKN